MECQSPRRAVWGGPPGGAPQPPPAAAGEAAFAPRQTAPLASLVRRSAPEIDLVAGVTTQELMKAPTTPADPTPGSPPQAGAPGQAPTPPKASRGACSVGGYVGSGGEMWAGVLGALVALAWLRRRSA